MGVILGLFFLRAHLKGLGLDLTNWFDVLRGIFYEKNKNMSSVRGKVFYWYNCLCWSENDYLCLVNSMHIKEHISCKVIEIAN